MKALVFHKPKDVEVETVDDPKILEDRDAIIKVTSTAICGSDLHIYNGFIPQGHDMVLGHEFMGIVEEVGKGVTNLKRGDRVVVPFPVACGHCHFCATGMVSACEHSNPEHYGPEGGILDQKGGGLFGYTDLYGGYDGGQAEYVRVPYADFGPRKISDRFTDEEVLFLTDIFPTGWTGIDWAQLKGGETVVVWGCGPVGIMAQKAAWLQGAGRVIGLDTQQYRIDIAKKAANSETILVDKIEDAVAQVRQMTDGRGAEVCVDAVGLEGNRTFPERATSFVHFQAGTINPIMACLSSVKRGGTVSILGVYGTNYDNFPLGQAFDKGVTLKMGQAPVQKYIDTLIKLLEDGKVRLDDIITHKLPLSEAANAYKIFNAREDNCLKVVLKPGA